MAISREIIATLMAAAPKEVPDWFRPDVSNQSDFDLNWVNSPTAEQYLNDYAAFFETEIGARPKNLFEAIDMVKSHFEAQMQKKARDSFGDIEKLMEIKFNVDRANDILEMLKSILDQEKEMPENQPFIHAKAKREIAEQAQWAAVWAMEAHDHLEHVMSKMLKKGISAFADSSRERPRLQLWEPPHR